VGEGGWLTGCVLSTFPNCQPTGRFLPLHCSCHQRQEDMLEQLQRVSFDQPGSASLYLSQLQEAAPPVAHGDGARCDGARCDDDTPAAAHTAIPKTGAAPSPMRDPTSHDRSAVAQSARSVSFGAPHGAMPRSAVHQHRSRHDVREATTRAAHGSSRRHKPHSRSHSHTGTSSRRHRRRRASPGSPGRRRLQVEALLILERDRECVALRCAARRCVALGCCGSIP